MSNQISEGITQQIQVAIEKLRNGTATQEEVFLVKDYLAIVGEMIDLFEDTVRNNLVGSNV